MPKITRAFIRTALAFGLLGVALSTLWVVNLVWPRSGVLGAIQPTALHLIVVGWLTQLIFGVALWMFPPWSRQAPRGRESLNWACYGMLNTGLLVRTVAEPFNTVFPHPAFGFLLLALAVLQLGAVWLFVAAVWTRVRGKR